MSWHNVNIEEQDIAIIGKHRFQLIGKLQHLIMRGSVIFTISDIDNRWRITVLVMMLFHPVFDQSFCTFESLIHVCPITIMASYHPLFLLYFLDGDSLSGTYLFLYHFLLIRIITNLFWSNKVSSFKIAIPGTISLSAITYHGNIKVMASLIVLHASLHQLVDLGIYNTGNSLR